MRWVLLRLWGSLAGIVGSGLLVSTIVADRLQGPSLPWGWERLVADWNAGAVFCLLVWFTGRFRHFWSVLRLLHDDRER